MKIVLLRGINVGGRNRLPMADLRTLIEQIGGRDVTTYIQSGNAIVTGDIEPGRLGDAIEARFGFRPAVAVIDAERFREITAASPFRLEDGVHIFFAVGELSFDLEAALTNAAASEQVAASEHAVYLNLPDGMARSKLANKLDRFANVELTGRNARTITKLTEMLDRSLGDASD